MTDTRNMRAILAVGLSAALGAIIGEHFIKPKVNKAVKKRRR